MNYMFLYHQVHYNEDFDLGFQKECSRVPGTQKNWLPRSGGHSHVELGAQEASTQHLPLNGRWATLWSTGAQEKKIGS